MRTPVDLPEDLVQALDALARQRGTSRTALIREAVADYVARNRRAPGAAFGLRRERTGSGIAYQERLRDEWEG